MSEKVNPLVPVSQVSNLPAMPEHLVGADQTSLAELKAYVRPPRVRVVQAMSDPAMMRDVPCGNGDVVLLPQGLMLNPIPRDASGNPLDTGGAFIFTPIFFFAEFCCWNPLKLKGTVPAIRERTFDPNTNLARLCKNPGARRMPYPEDKDNPELFIQNVEHMNFIIMIDGIEEACVMSFARSEFKAGQKFAGLLSMRKCPIYGGRYAAYTGHRENAQGNWFGLDVTNPPEETGSPWADAASFEAFKEMNATFAKQHADAQIRVDYEEAPQDESGGSSAAADTI